MLATHGDTSRATKDEYSKEFDKLESTQARSLIVAIAPIFAVFVGIITLGRRRPLVQHAVFALHSLSFLLVFVIVSDYLINRPLYWILDRLAVKPGLYGYDDQTSMVMLALIAAYFALAVRRAYGVSNLRAWPTGLALGLALFISITTYRGLLFFVTFYSR